MIGVSTDPRKLIRSLSRRRLPGVSRPSALLVYVAAPMIFRLGLASVRGVASFRSRIVLGGNGECNRLFMSPTHFLQQRISVRNFALGKVVARFPRLADDSSDSSDCAYSRPEVILEKPDICNKAQLIGRLNREIDLRYLDDGLVVANSYLALQGPKTESTSDDTMVVQVVFWSKLAEIAAAHLRMGDYIYVAGSLRLESYLALDNVEKWVCKVVVRDVKFVETETSNWGYPRAIPKTAGNTIGTGSLWQAFFTDPSQWWDNRNKKISPRSPDFRHKTTGEVLWIDSTDTPEWVKSQIELLDSRVSTGGQTAKVAVWFEKKSTSAGICSSFQDEDLGPY